MEDFAEQLEILAEEIEREFGSLSPEQLNWKPDPDSWSVGQCLDHLVVTNKLELITIEKALKGEHTKTIWERLPVLPSLLGNFVVKAVDPANVRKNKAPKVFAPSKSDVDADVLKVYLSTSARAQQMMKDAKGMEIDKMVITSPIARIATYSLGNAFRIIVLHDRRHFEQARRVIQNEGFPG